jgi:hypothetical protein
MSSIFILDIWLAENGSSYHRRLFFYLGSMEFEYNSAKADGRKYNHQYRKMLSRREKGGADAAFSSGSLDFYHDDHRRASKLKKTGYPFCFCGND